MKFFRDLSSYRFTYMPIYLNKSATEPHRSSRGTTAAVDAFGPRSHNRKRSGNLFDPQRRWLCGSGWFYEMVAYGMAVVVEGLRRNYEPVMREEMGWWSGGSDERDIPTTDRRRWRLASTMWRKLVALWECGWWRGIWITRIRWYLCGWQQMEVEFSLSIAWSVVLWYSEECNHGCG